MVSLDDGGQGGDITEQVVEGNNESAKVTWAKTTARTQALVPAKGQVREASKDHARIEHLRSSIGRVEGEIEKTRRDLNTTCDALRTSTNASETDDSSARQDAPENKLVMTGTATNASSVKLPETPIGVDNDEILNEARSKVNGHIRGLNRYNQLKDIAMGLFELIAEHKGVGISEVLRDEGVEVDD